jgi:hypothetical protein
MAGSNAGTVGSSPVWASGLDGLSREQVPTVAVLVAVVVVLLLVGGGAAFVLLDSGDEDGNGPSANGSDSAGNGAGTDAPGATLGVDVTADAITVLHEDGESVDPGEVGVTVLHNGERSELTLAEFDEQPDDSERFEAGEQFAYSGGPYAGSVTVFVIHEPTNVTLADTTVEVDPELNLTLEGITNASGESLFVGDDVAVEFALNAPGGTVQSPVTVTVDGEVAFEETVTVESGTTVAETVTAAADLGDGLDVAVETDQDSVTESLDAPSLGVAFDGEPDTSPADIGYTVENTGDIGAEQPITLTSTAADGSALAETEQTERVAGGETVTGTFQSVALGAGGELTLAAGADTASLTLGESTFEVVSLDVPSEVDAGTGLTVAYEVENTGSFTDMQNVTFSAGGDEVAVDAGVTLDAGEREEGTFEYTPSADDAPGLTVAVSTADDTAEADIGVALPDEATFTVDIDGTNAPLAAGETLVTTATVENAGEATGTQSVVLDGPVVEGNSTQLSLDAGESTQVTLSTAVDASAAGVHEVTVSTEDDEDTIEMEILDGGTDPTSVFEIVGFDAPSEVEPGAELPVSYEVQNTGDGAGTGTIAFLVDGTEADAASGVSLDPGETVSGTFTYDVTSGDAVTVAVATDDDSESSEVQVAQSTPDGDLVASLSTEQAAVGETVSVDLNVLSVDDTSDVFGSYSIVLSYDDSVLEFKRLSPGAFGSPSSMNAEQNVIAVADFQPNGETPAEPALTFEFEVIADGTATISFDNSVDVPADNEINGPNGNTYETTFEDGSVTTT